MAELMYENVVLLDREVEFEIPRHDGEPATIDYVKHIFADASFLAYMRA